MFTIIFVLVLLFIGVCFLATRIVYGISPITQYIIFKRAKKNVLKLITNKDWVIVSFRFSDITKEYYFSDRKKEYFYYRIYIEVKNDKIENWTNDFIEVNKKGEIIKERLTESMKYYENYKLSNK